MKFLLHEIIDRFSWGQCLFHYVACCCSGCFHHHHNHYSLSNQSKRIHRIRSIIIIIEIEIFFFSFWVIPRNKLCKLLVLVCFVCVLRVFFIPAAAQVQHAFFCCCCCRYCIQISWEHNRIPMDISDPNNNHHHHHIACCVSLIKTWLVPCCTWFSFFFLVWIPVWIFLFYFSFSLFDGNRSLQKENCIDEQCVQI